MNQVVLVGAGHTHAYVLERWRRVPIPDAQLTCVSPTPFATYSGMLPGVLAGQYPREAMQIGLVALCAAAGARLVVATAVGVDVPSRRLQLEGAASLPFDVLSVGVGSVPARDGVRVDSPSALVAVKPMQTFLDRLSGALAARGAVERPPQVAVVGGGAAGVELGLCLLPFFATLALPSAPRCQLVTAGTILEGHRAGTVIRARAALARHGVSVREHAKVVTVGADRLTFDDGTSTPADVTIWATAASGAPFLRATGLPLDARGFLRTSRTLQSVAGVPVFAVGDAGTIDGLAVPKAGVHAVRQGPVLWANLQRSAAGRPLKAYAPQRSFLTLLNTGDGSAIGEWQSLSFEGRLAARLKTWIDTRFVGRYQAHRR